MSNLTIGILCLALSLLQYFYSPKNISILGYKSLQLSTHKNIWKWSNKCFGLLAIIGSTIYLLASIILSVLSINEYDSIMNDYGIAYILVCVFITEIYTFVCAHKSKNKNDGIEGGK